MHESNTLIHELNEFYCWFIDVYYLDSALTAQDLLDWKQLCVFCLEILI
jgi:hypothetical protein